MEFNYEFSCSYINNDSWNNYTFGFTKIKNNVSGDSYLSPLIIRVLKIKFFSTLIIKILYIIREKVYRSSYGKS